MPERSLTHMLLLVITISSSGLHSGAELCVGHERFLSCTCTRMANQENVFEKHLDCSLLGYTDIPAYLPADTVYLDLSNNTILPGNMKHLSWYKSLKNVSLAYNQISKIPPYTFANCSLLTSLNMEGNKLDLVSRVSLVGLELITELVGIESHIFDPDSFSGMHSLKDLILVTHQDSIPDQLFTGPKLNKLEMQIRSALRVPDKLLQNQSETLIELIISSRTVKVFPRDLLVGLTLLKNITIDVLDVDSLPSSIFHHNNGTETQNQSTDVNLKEATISGVKSLPGTLFRGLKSIETLSIHGAVDLPGNLFKDLVALDSLDISSCFTGHGHLPSGWFSALSRLKSLNLSHCNLNILSAEDLTGLSSLFELDLSFNNIRFIDESMFNEVRYSLESLILRSNSLSVINPSTFKRMTNLRYLDLNDNKIVLLHESTFSDTINLFNLNLCQNKIDSLSAGLFSGLRNLQYLNMASNSLHSVPEDLFNNMTSLTETDFSNNHIVHFPIQDFVEMRQVERVNLMNNPLNCTCYLKWINLMAWINVTGTCGSPVHLIGHSLNLKLPNIHCSPTDMDYSRPFSMPSPVFPLALANRETETTLTLTTLQSNDNVTIEDSVQDSASFYTAMTVIIGVGVVCLLAVGALYYFTREKRRTRLYEVRRTVNNFDPPVIKVTQYEFDSENKESEEEDQTDDGNTQNSGVITTPY